MASEQMPRRVVEREVHTEEHRKEVPLGKGERESEKNKEKEKELLPHRAKTGNIAKDKEAEEGRSESGGGLGGVHGVGTGSGEKAQLQSRTREVVGREWNKEEEQRCNYPKGKVEAEKARTTAGKTREDAKAREKSETKGQTKEVGGEKQGREREGARAGEKEQPSLEEITKYRAEAQQKSMDAIASAQERYQKANQALKKGGGEEQVREQKREENEQPSFEEISKCRAEAQQKVKEREEKGKPSFEEISKYRDEAQQKVKERQESAKQEAPNNATQSQTAKEKNMQAEEKETKAKDVTREKGQQGHVEAKDVTREKGQQGHVEAKDVTREKGQQGHVEAKDVTREKGQQGHVEAKDEAEEKGDEAKDNTISSVAKSAIDYTAPIAEKAKSAGDTTAQYVGEKAVQAKDATVETGKSAAKVAADWKDKATVAGWSAAQFSTEKTVEGTEAATNVVIGAADYAGQKASEFAAKSVDTAKGLAAAAGENAKDFTARKKEEAARDLEAKRVAQNQESKEWPSAKNTTESFQSAQEQEGQESQIGLRGKGREPVTSIDETLGSVAQTVTKPLDKATEGGREMLGAVGETVVVIGETMMIKPAQKVQQEGEEGKVGGVFNAIGETIAEIAETTTVIVAGEGENESRTTHEYDHGKQGDLKLD